MGTPNDLPSPRFTHEDSPFLGEEEFDLEENSFFPIAALVRDACPLNER